MTSAFGKAAFLALALTIATGLVVPASSATHGPEPVTPDSLLVEHGDETDQQAAPSSEPLVDEPGAERIVGGGYPMLTAQKIYYETGRFPDLDGRTFGTSPTRVSLSGYPAAERGQTVEGEPMSRGVSSDQGYPAPQP